jgi:hypothetical protein
VPLTSPLVPGEDEPAVLPPEPMLEPPLPIEDSDGIDPTALSEHDGSPAVRANVVSANDAFFITSLQII